MSKQNQSSLRIDWFDGTVIEEPRYPDNTYEEEPTELLASSAQPRTYTERKLMGYKRLHDLSNQGATTLILQLSEKSSFWDLLNSELKDDYIVLIVKIISKLYISLLSGQKSVMMKRLLEAKFINSNFLKVLTEYMLKVPYVRVTEKRVNMQFWDDPESFYVNVLLVCEGICKLNSVETKLNVKLVLEAVRASVNGVMIEHMEQFNQFLFRKMDELEETININYKVSNNEEQGLQKKNFNENPKNFHNLSIFPTYDDLLSKTPCKIEPNIVNGAYSSVEHYLDVQFKLLREDCFGPLREGITEYMDNPKKKRFENIRVHPKVRIIRPYVSNNKVGYLVDIAWNERLSQSSVDSKQCAFNKQLMFGSLLIFTNNNFKTILCATVLDSNLDLLRKGYLAVTFHSSVSKNIFLEPYLMVESEVFFEPYHRVLKVLQNFDNDEIPMQRYIVEVQAETKEPGYLSPETMYNVPLKIATGEVSFNVLDTKSWPDSERLGFDDSQMEAYKLALTREFAVIQGPPGTGKTFIGVEVATTILKNLSLEGTPMLLICYTNHALDQFLEGLLKVTKNIIRLGSQSKNENIQPYTLNNLRAKIRSKYAYLYTNKRIELENIFKEMIQVQTEIEKCETEILAYKTVKPYLKSKHGLINNTKEDSILNWLFGHLDDENSEEHINKKDDTPLDDWEKGLDDIDRNKFDDLKKVDTCFSEKWALKEIDSMLHSIKYVKDVTTDQDEAKKMTDKFQSYIDKIKRRLTCFKKQQNESVSENIKTEEIVDLYTLNYQDRWNLYFTAVKSIKDKFLSDMNNLRIKYDRCNQELDEIATLVDAEIVKTVRVVGVTTTTAARRHDLLRTLKSPIVIVEEAAEVLEAHVVASLTNYCQHVILIGDHKQLRPTAAHYKLARECNLEISLFERMIKNLIHARTLTMQRRMRPDFVDLIVPAVYEKLDSHPSVQNYPNIRGMKNNLYFLSHNVYEDEVHDNSWSHRNKFEASWCVALADYLRQMNYKTDEITILATYAGQATVMKELSKSYERLHGIKITVVDNYQGEENKIVILSLVRSNKDGKIGFLVAQNRICVALSRAKEGFYIFGNLELLKGASTIWRKINSKLVSQNAIGQSLTLRCRYHPNNELIVQKVEDFNDCNPDGCLKICEQIKTKK